jgi:hypothetical protein
MHNMFFNFNSDSEYHITWQYQKQNNLTIWIHIGYKYSTWHETAPDDDPLEFETCCALDTRP